jgi:predicted TPR repeat methyltransferase
MSISLRIRGERSLSFMRLPLPPSIEAVSDVTVHRAQIISVYDSYAAGYDNAAEADGYFSPGQIARSLATAVADHQACILDMACGTGLVGEQLHRLGYRNLIGADITFSMLSRARAKDCYSLVVQADANTPLPFAARSFDAITSAGAFYDGDLRATALENLLPLLKPGGYFFCDIEMHAWDHYGFRQLFEHPQIQNVFSDLTIEPAKMFRASGDEEQQGYYVTARMA